jgi:hypothetical protein
MHFLAMDLTLTGALALLGLVAAWAVMWRLIDAQGEEGRVQDAMFTLLSGKRGAVAGRRAVVGKTHEAMSIETPRAEAAVTCSFCPRPPAAVRAVTVRHDDGDSESWERKFRPLCDRCHTALREADDAGLELKASGETWHLGHLAGPFGSS